MVGVGVDEEAEAETVAAPVTGGVVEPIVGRDAKLEPLVQRYRMAD